MGGWGGWTPSASYYPCTLVTPTRAPINHLGFKIFTCCLPVSVQTFRAAPPQLWLRDPWWAVSREGSPPGRIHFIVWSPRLSSGASCQTNSQGPTTFFAWLLKYAALRTEVRLLNWFFMAPIHLGPDLQNKVFPLDFPSKFPKLISLRSVAPEVSDVNHVRL